MLCKDCEHLKKDTHVNTKSLEGRKYHCKKYRMGVILKKPEDIEALECCYGKWV